MGTPTMNIQQPNQWIKSVYLKYKKHRINIEDVETTCEIHFTAPKSIIKPCDLFIMFNNDKLSTYNCFNEALDGDLETEQTYCQVIIAAINELNIQYNGLPFIVKYDTSKLQYQLKFILYVLDENLNSPCEMWSTDQRLCRVLGWIPSLHYQFSKHSKQIDYSYIQPSHKMFINLARKLNVSCQQIRESNFYELGQWRNLLLRSTYGFQPGTSVEVQANFKASFSLDQLIAGISVCFYDELYNEIELEDPYQIVLYVNVSQKMIVKQQRIMEEMQARQQERQQQLQAQQQQQQEKNQQMLDLQKTKLQQSNYNLKQLQDLLQPIIQSENEIKNVVVENLVDNQQIDNIFNAFNHYAAQYNQLIRDEQLFLQQQIPQLPDPQNIVLYQIDFINKQMEIVNQQGQTLGEMQKLGTPIHQLFDQAKAIRNQKIQFQQQQQEQIQQQQFQMEHELEEKQDVINEQNVQINQQQQDDIDDDDQEFQNYYDDQQEEVLNEIMRGTIMDEMKNQDKDQEIDQQKKQQIKEQWKKIKRQKKQRVTKKAGQLLMNNFQIKQQNDDELNPQQAKKYADFMIKNEKQKQQKFEVVKIAEHQQKIDEAEQEALDQPIKVKDEDE